MKLFICDVVMKNETYYIKAKNKTEARKKLNAKLAKLSVLKLIDKKQSDVAEY